MKKVLVLLVIGLMVASTFSVYAVGTPDEAKGLVQKAAKFLKANGKEKAFAKFNDQKGPFKKDDLYIFVLDMKGVTLAHGANIKFVGKDMINFIKEIVEGAKTEGSGWADYKWTHPETKKMIDKTTYYMKVDDLIVACGVYKN
jgi:cytochrome c